MLALKRLPTITCLFFFISLALQDIRPSQHISTYLLWSHTEILSTIGYSYVLRGCFNHLSEPWQQLETGWDLSLGIERGLGPVFDRFFMDVTLEEAEYDPDEEDENAAMANVQWMREKWEELVFSREVVPMKSSSGTATPNSQTQTPQTK